VLYAAIDALIAQAVTLPVCIALSLPGSITPLAFTEQRCLQCGLCANVCPEKAVTLTPLAGFLCGTSGA